MQGSAQGEESFPLGARTIQRIGWDTLASIGGGVEDSVLLRARLIAAGNGTLYAFDFADRQLKAFDREGQLYWRFGRRGGGPGEFGSPTDLQVAADGDVWVTDAGNARITIISPEGTLRKHIAFDGQLIMRTLPREGARLIFPTVAESFWLAIDDGGQVVAEGGLATQELREANPSVRPPVVSMSSDGSTWAAAFPVGDPLLVYRDLELHCTGRLVEGGPFPQEFAQGTPVWTVGIAAADSSVFVLARGETEYELQLLDEYSLRDCRYLRTLLLPGKLQGIAYDAGVFFFYHEDPVPLILALRPRGRLPHSSRTIPAAKSDGGLSRPGRTQHRAQGKFISPAAPRSWLRISVVIFQGRPRSDAAPFAFPPDPTRSVYGRWIAPAPARA